MKRWQKWLLITGSVLLIGGAGLYYFARKVAARFEPYIREQAILYLQDRFDADVDIGDLKVRLPTTSNMRLAFSKGRGAMASVTAHRVVLKRRNREGEPPILSIKSFSFRLDLGRVFEPRKEVRLVNVDGMEIHIPPKGDRRISDKPRQEAERKSESALNSVQIDEILVTNAKLVIHPRDPKKFPLDFDIHRLRMETTGFEHPMKYEAQLRNPKPPGQIDSTGTFGPWVAEEPGDSPLQGVYKFQKADLGVFRAIGGILNSTGSFEGVLSEVHARGQASVPDFHLKMSGNKVPLTTTFEVEVDGTNGNTILKPVHAQLGKSKFTTSGSIIKHEEDPRRTIILDAIVPAGRMEDFLLLAMKGHEPMLTGVLNLKTKIQVPPLTGKVVEKLRLAGTFELKEGHFLKSHIQDRLDELSRKGQGQPKNEAIDEVISSLGGEFVLENQSIQFSRLTFGVPGADIALAGGYDLESEAIDFHGTLKLQAKVSQTQTGIKRWVLKPVDPFFSKEGAGTFLKIKIDGTRSAPKFGQDKTRK